MDDHSLPSIKYSFCMHPQISTQQVPEAHFLDDMLDVVETRMIECISPNTTRISRKSASASDAAAYHLGLGGQRVRAKLALRAGLALGVSSADAITIAATVELLHNASLVHDDIQDHDEMRRGQPAVWVHFGVNTAICTGDLLLSAAYAALCKLENSRALPAMVSLVHERTSMAIDGQCADLMAVTDAVGHLQSAITRYQQIAVAKSGALLCLPIELVLLASGQDRYLSDARHAVEAFAIGYQIVDDLNDMKNDAGIGTTYSAFNIISIYRPDSGLPESTEKAKKLGRQHLETAIKFAARLPCGAGALLIDDADRLRKLLVEKN
jgi:geranylgeranyl pyrophosphate synthase